MDELELLKWLVVKLTIRVLENPVAFGAIIAGSSIALALLCPCCGVETVDVGTQTTWQFIIPIRRALHTIVEESQS